MKYMISTYASQQDYDSLTGRATAKPAWSAADFAALGAFMELFNQELVESGELVETRGLSNPVHTRRVQLQNGVVAVTDGPYAETYEVLAGYSIVECASFDRATAIAARLATCPGPLAVAQAAVADVRPIADVPGRARASDASRRSPRSRTCCAGWRRRSSARSSGGTGISTAPRTRSKKP